MKTLLEILMPNQVMHYTELIKKWKLSQRMLSERIGMPEPTFKNKLNEKQSKYHFTEEEEKKIKSVLEELKNDL